MKLELMNKSIIVGYRVVDLPAAWHHPEFARLSAVCYCIAPKSSRHFSTGYCQIKYFPGNLNCIRMELELLDTVIRLPSCRRKQSYSTFSPPLPALRPFLHAFRVCLSRSGSHHQLRKWLLLLAIIMLVVHNAATPQCFLALCCSWWSSCSLTRRGAVQYKLDDSFLNLLPASPSAVKL